MNEPRGRISTSKEFMKGLLCEVGQPVVAIRSVGKETVEFACDNAV